MMSIGDESTEEIMDHWDTSSHTEFENSVVAALKMLAGRVMSPSDLYNFSKSIPYLYGGA
jgi:hypothetical protein